MVKRKKIRGTFLIEAVVAMALLGAFAGGLVAYLTPQYNKAADAKVKNDLNEIRNGLDMYYNDFSCYPLALPGCNDEFSVNGNVYVKNMPCNEKVPYRYETENLSCNRWFKLLGNLKNPKDPSVKAVGCQNGCGLNCDYNYGVSSTNKTLSDGCPYIPTNGPLPSNSPSTIPTPIEPPNFYACSPGGACIQYSYPELSECPKVYIDNDVCFDECEDRINRCKNEKGKKPTDY